MPVPVKQFDDIERILDGVSLKAKNLLKGIDDELYDRILRYIRKFSTKNGVFVADGTQNQILNGIKKELDGLLKQSQINDFVRELQVDFDGLAQNIRFLQGEENGLRVPNSLVTEQKRLIIDDLTEDLFKSGYDARFAIPVKKALFTNVNFGGTVSDTERLIKALVRGQDGDGLLTRYAGTVARDALRDYTGRVNTAIAIKHDLKHVRYVGNIIKDSRWQCRRWVQMEYLRKEDLDEEIRKAFRQGSGMIPGTTPANFCMKCGGYNCMHTAFPVREIPQGFNTKNPPSIKVPGT